MATFVPTLHLSSYPGVSPTRPEVSVNGKSVMVTGGGYGIGKSIAEAFAIAGASRLALSGRTEATLKTTTTAFQKQYPATKFTYFVADITDAAAVKAMFDSFGAPDILINNAGFLSQPEELKTGDLKEWWKSFEINVLGTATVIQSYFRTKSADKKGVVITLNTLGAHWGRFPKLSAYAASKAASLRMIEMIQSEAPEVRFVSVHPGAIHTDMGVKSGLTGLDMTDLDLAASFVLWASSSEAEFLKGRFAWANWDVEELKAKKDEILKKDLLHYTIEGV